MEQKMPFASLSAEQEQQLKQAEQQLNAQMGGAGEIIVLAYKNE